MSEGKAPDAQWTYTPDEEEIAPTKVAASATGTASAARQSVHMEWTASEFIAHQKGPGWYIVFTLAAAVLAVGLYLITRDSISTAAIVILSVVFGVIAGRQPRMLEYQLDAKGVSVGGLLHPYAAYKSFAIMQEGPFSSIVLLPYKRFSLPLSMYVAPDEQQRIIEALASYLPLQPGGTDFVERLMHRIHF
ncbi:MAG TPA: hypothetical protein VLF91_01750 [Candidatus Saccharimonadales bacterium]|nr:hypothetical protein [Candidatus Saccharimonadales bacterium]